MEVRAEVVGNRIAVKAIQRFPGDLEMSKQVPGGRWNKEDRYWHYPLTWVSCLVLRKVYTDMLVLGPQLDRWGREEKRRIQKATKLAGSMDARLRIIPGSAPALDAAMSSRTYQRVGARFLAEHRTVLLADEPTLGKTIQYLGGLVEGENTQGVHLVIAPKSSLRSVWAEEIFKWTDFHPFWMPEGRARREHMLSLFMEDEHPVKFLCINPEMLQTKIEQWCKKCDAWRTPAKEVYDQWPEVHFTDDHKPKPLIQKQDWPELFGIDWASICIDEAHTSLLGNRGKNKTQAAEGLTRLRLAEGGMRIASTGTPLKGHALSFWSIFNWLRPDIWTSKWAYAESFLELTKHTFGTDIGDVAPGREQALQDTLRTIMLRRTKKEVQPDLPDDVYIDHWVDLEGEHAKQYNEIVDGGEAEIEGGALSIKGVLEEMTRRKVFAFAPQAKVHDRIKSDPFKSPKAWKLLELLGERGVLGDPKKDFRLEGGYKYIIGSQFSTNVLAPLQEFLSANNIQSLRITGSVSAKVRDQAVKDFQTNPDSQYRVLLVNTLAGGTALTLDAYCDEMFILDETWVDDEQFQLEGRIRNRNPEKRTATRFFHYIRTRGTIEEEIADSGVTQAEFKKTILDRARGVRLDERKIQK